jgi:hypothetical protein
MTVRTSPWLMPMLGIACLLAAGNAVLYWRMSTRLTALESTLLASSSGAQTAVAETSSSSLPYSAPLPAGANNTTRQASLPPGGPDPVLTTLAQRKAAFTPDQAAAELDRQLAAEPSLPAIEQRQARILQEALARMPADAPQPTGLQTTCRGRRCLISAGFADDLQASQWAQRLLLVGGKEFPRSARIIPVPVAGGDGAVTLQLYLN